MRVTTQIEAQNRQPNAASQAQRQDGRYLVYMRGIT